MQGFRRVKTASTRIRLPTRLLTMPTSPSAARAAASTLSVDEALERVLARIEPLAPTEVGLLDALGGVLAEDATADRDVPPFRNSAMDGYAVRGSDVARDGVKLRVVGSEERRVGKECRSRWSP